MLAVARWTWYGITNISVYLHTRGDTNWKLHSVELYRLASYLSKIWWRQRQAWALPPFVAFLIIQSSLCHIVECNKCNLQSCYYQLSYKFIPTSDNNCYFVIYLKYGDMFRVHINATYPISNGGCEIGKSFSRWMSYTAPMILVWLYWYSVQALMNYKSSMKIMDK